MTKIIAVIFSFILLLAAAFATAPAGYYDSADGLTGTALKAALHNIIDNHTDYGYDNAKIQIFQYIHVKSSYTYCVYTGRRAQSTGYPDNDDINCEHIWPQSYGCDSSPMKSDMFHLLPSDMPTNSTRSNYPFGYVSSGTTKQNLNDGLYEDDWVGTSNTTITTGWCEPRDEVKGDIARALFYMDTRYNGDTGGELDLKLSESPSSGNYQMAKLSVLLEWHAQDPPSPHELWMNDKIYNDLQHNRNPFIDHPEYVCQIYGGCDGDSVAPIFAGLTSASATGVNGVVDLSWGAATDDSPPINYNIYRGTASGAQDYGTPVATTTDVTYTDSGLTNDITYYYVVRAEDSEGNEDHNTAEYSAMPYNADGTPPVFGGVSNVWGTGASSTVKLNWTAATDTSTPITYNIYRAAFSGGQNLGNTTATTTELEYTDTGLVNGITYYYIVRAEDYAGNEDANSTELGASPFISEDPVPEPDPDPDPDPQPWTDLIIIYPNPAHGPVRVSNLPGDSSVDIYSGNGELVESSGIVSDGWTWEAKSGRFTVKSGIYLMVIRAEGEVLIRKVAFINGEQ